MSLYSPYYPLGAQFDDNAPWNGVFDDEPDECSSCHQTIDPDFEVIVWLNVGHGLSESFHALCGANEWAESLDLPVREEI